MSQAEMTNGWRALQTGNPDQAAAIFQVALKRNVNDMEALLGLAKAHALGANYARATSLYRRAAAIRPDDEGILSELGELLRVQHRYKEVVALLNPAIDRGIESPSVHLTLAASLMDLRAFSEAEVVLRRLTRIAPDNAKGWNLLGRLLFHELDRLEEAESALKRALEANPEMAMPRTALASLYRGQQRLEEAREMARKAVDLTPEKANAHYQLGLIELDLCRVAAALEAFRRAVEIKPDEPEYHVFIAFCHLLNGNYREGFREYEWRLRLEAFRNTRNDRPMWDGRDLEGRPILLLSEQGAGDSLQFVRYVQRVRDRGGRPVLITNKSLAALFATVPGVEEVCIGVDKETLKTFDFYAPLLSLPHVFEDDFENVPRTVPYFILTPEDKEPMEQLIAHLPRPRVGLVWQGNPKNIHDSKRSVPLRFIEELVHSVDGVSFVSIQKYMDKHRPPPEGVFDAAPHLESYMDTAAMISALDLVIAIDTSVAHLAGGLGAELWVPFPVWAEWRWGLEGEQAPWYPTARIFRQEERGDWEPVFERITEELKRFAGNRGGCPL